MDSTLLLAQLLVLQVTPVFLPMTTLSAGEETEAEGGGAGGGVGDGLESGGPASWGVV